MSWIFLSSSANFGVSASRRVVIHSHPLGLSTRLLGSFKFAERGLPCSLSGHSIRRRLRGHPTFVQQPDLIYRLHAGVTLPAHAADSR